jgi:hypothetical protein
MNLNCNKKVKTKIYKGILEIDGYGLLKCGNSYLIEDVELDFKMGDNVFVSYYVTDKEVTEDEARKALIIKTIGGNIEELQFDLVAYSEWTIISLEEELKIGGHSLCDELRGYEGKFITLIVTGVLIN